MTKYREPYPPEQIRAALATLEALPRGASILDDAASLFRLPSRVMREPTRGPIAVARARQVAMTAMRRRGMTYPAIGRAMRRDHSTIQHGTKR